MRLEAIIIGAIGGLCAICITALAITALHYNVDGVLLKSAFAGVGGIIAIVGMYIVRIIRETRATTKAKKGVVDESLIP